MLFHISSYSLVYLAAGLVTLFTASLAWKRRPASGGIWLFLAVLAAGEWSMADFMDVSSYGMLVKIFWGKLSYLGSASIAVFLLLFALEFTHRGKWITRRKVLLLMIVPVLSILLAFTNDWHHLLWSGFSYVSASTNVLIYHHGPLYWAMTVYIYSAILVAAWFLIEFALRSRELYLLQSIGMLIGTLIPLDRRAGLRFFSRLSAWIRQFSHHPDLLRDYFHGQPDALETTGSHPGCPRNPGRSASGCGDRAGWFRPDGRPEPGGA